MQGPAGTRAEIASGARMAKFQAARGARVGMVMEPQDHPGLSDDARISHAARTPPPNTKSAEPADHPGLSDADIAANDRQVRALGKIRGVGDLPVITRDAATNYGDKGLYEVGDLIYRTLKADPEQGRELLDQTTSGISADRADRLKATVNSLALDDDPELAGQHGNDTLTGGAVGDRLQQLDYDKLSDREKSRLRFPNQQQSEEISNIERLKRKADAKNSVSQEMPKYQTPMQRPDSAEGEIRSIIHDLGLKPEMNERFNNSDIETLRLFKRFRQLDEKDTAILHERLADLGKRDESLLHALVQKKFNAEQYPKEEIWSMSDKELVIYLQQMDDANPAAAHASNEARQVIESLKKPYIGGLFSKQAEITGGKLTPHEQRIEFIKTEIDRRRGWGERR